jgi:hypothetical protein
MGKHGEILMSEETKVACPKCGSSELVITLANQKHCNACSEEFQIDRHPVASAAYRRKSEGVRGGWRRPDVPKKN